MIYNPILDLSQDELISTCVVLAIATLHVDGITDIMAEWQIVRFRGILARVGVYLSAKRLNDVWFFRYGWI